MTDIASFISQKDCEGLVMTVELQDYRGNPIYSDFGLFLIEYMDLLEFKQALVTHDLLMTFLESDCSGLVTNIQYLGLSDAYLKGEKKIDRK